MAALIQRLDILYSFSWHHITLRHKSEAGCNNLQLPGRVKPWQCGLNTIWVKAACLIGSPSTILNIYSPHHWHTIAAVPAVCKISSSYSTRLFWQNYSKPRTLPLRRYYRCLGTPPPPRIPSKFITTPSWVGNCLDLNSGIVFVLHAATRRIATFQSAPPQDKWPYASPWKLVGEKQCKEYFKNPEKWAF